jgi:hypothetical protein
MRHEDIPPANEYERGVVANRREPCAPQSISQAGGLALLRPFVRSLLNLKLPFTRLKIGFLDDAILVYLQRMPGRVNVYPTNLNDERKEKMEEFCARKGLEPFTESFGFESWSAEPFIGYIFKGTQVAELVTELLVSVCGARGDEEFRFALM